jgi:hypothetical protein
MLNLLNNIRNNGFQVHEVNMIQPHHFEAGGYVQSLHKNIPSYLLKQNDVDTVLARVQPGEIVIPTKYTKKVAEFLRDENIKLPNVN